MGEKPEQRNVAKIAERMTQRAEETTALFRALTPDELASPVYSEGANWTVRDILCHFVATERALLHLFQNIDTGEGGTPDDFDLNRYNESQVARLSDVPVEGLLEQFEAARAETIAFVRSLDDAALETRGRHPWFGNDRLEKFLKLVYRHNMIHERDIRRALEARTT